MKISEQRENWKWIFSLHDRSRLPSSPFWGERDGMDESAQFLGDKFSAPLVFWACKISCIIFCSCLSLEINSQFSYNYFFAPLCLWVRLGWRSDSLEEKRVSSSNDESMASEKLITFILLWCFVLKEIIAVDGHHPTYSLLITSEQWVAWGEIDPKRAKLSWQSSLLRTSAASGLTTLSGGEHILDQGGLSFKRCASDIN